MEFIALFRIMKRQRKLILVSFLAFFVAVVLATELATPIYKSRVKVLLYKGNSAVQSALEGVGLTSISAQVLQADSATDSFDTDIELAMTRPVVNELVRSLDLRDSDNELYDYEDMTKGLLLKLLLPKPHVKADQYEDSGMLELVAYGPDADKSAEIANKLAELYISRSVDRIKDEYGRAQSFVGEQMDQAVKNYLAALTAKRDYRVREKVVDISGETSNIMSLMNSTLEKIDQNERDRTTNAEKLRIAKERIGKLNPYWKNAETFAVNESRDNLQASINTLLVQMAELRQKITPEHPDYKTAEAKLKELQAQVAKETKLRLNEQSFSADPNYEALYSSIMTLTQALDAAETTTQVLRLDYQKYYRELLEVPEKEMGLERFDSDATVNRTMYERLSAVLATLSIAEKVSTSSVQVVEKASPPTRKFFPKRPINYILGLFMGLGLSLALAVLADYADKTIKDPDEIQVLGLPFLGTVLRDGGRQSAKAVRIGGQPLAAMAHDRQVAESLRSVASQVQNEIQRHGLRSLAICSIAAGEGRTTLATHLAESFSRLGKNVLLVDLDLRPAAAPGETEPNPAQTGGLGGYLAGQGTLAACVIKLSETLAVLGTGKLPTNPGRIIDEGLTAQLLSEAAGAYDLIVFDTPPLMESNDAAIIAGQAGYCLFVAAAGRTTARLVEQAVAIMTRFEALPIGVVLNKFAGLGLLHDRQSAQIGDLAPLFRRAWRGLRFSQK